MENKDTYEYPTPSEHGSYPESYCATPQTRAHRSDHKQLTARAKVLIMIAIIFLPFFMMLATRELLDSYGAIKWVVGATLITVLVVFLLKKTTSWRIVLTIVTMLTFVIGYHHTQMLAKDFILGIWLVIVATAIGLYMTRTDLLLRGLCVALGLCVYYVLYNFGICVKPISYVANSLAIAFYIGLIIALISKKTDRRWAITVIPATVLATIIFFPPFT